MHTNFQLILYISLCFIAIYVYNAAVLIYGRRRLRRGQQNTQKERGIPREISAFIVSTLYIGLFQDVWFFRDDQILVVSKLWNDVLKETQFDIGQTNEAIAMTRLFLRGFWSSMTIFGLSKDIFQNFKTNRYIAKENEIFQPHLNIVSTEMLHFNEVHSVLYPAPRAWPWFDIKEDGVLDEEISSVPPPYAADLFRRHIYDLPPEQKEIPDDTSISSSMKAMNAHKSRVAIEIPSVDIMISKQGWPN